MTDQVPYPSVLFEREVLGEIIGKIFSSRMLVAHFDKGCADGNSLLAVEENCSSFGFCGGSHDGADGLHLVSIVPIGVRVGRMWGGGGLLFMQ